MTRLMSLLAAPILVLLLTGPVTAQLQDQIYQYEITRPTRGVIDEVTATVVKIRVNSVVREVSVNNIPRITFADDPNELQQVRGMVRRKQYEAAKAELDKLNLEEQPNVWVQQDMSPLLLSQQIILWTLTRVSGTRIHQKPWMASHTQY